MGVPALFRWLSKKYPKIVEQVREDAPKRVRGPDGEIIEEPVRYESPNPNGFEVDNLYLDMNGIVHPCTHPEGRPAPETEEEMMVEIFRYTERVVNMTRPRKVLMMAIDGVAPRAKMNQQRSRRFRAAQEAAEKEEERKESIKLFEAMGHKVSEETANKKSWDTNAITPGTPFMDLLSISLKYWVSHKLTNDPGWKDLKVILSDSSVPGEGEHKIMDWIRRQRSYPSWDANTSHVIYGLDADLIMLSLATHEPHFRVLREDVFAQNSKGPNACRNCGKQGHFSANCKGKKEVKDPNVVEVAKPVDPKPFIFLDVACLREYLAIELNVPNVPFQFDLELAIDDWIFMIFFVGNDFLPHLPSLEIREGAIDKLLTIWRAELGRMGGYLTNHGKVNMGRAQVILEGLAKSEDEIFQQRKHDEDRQESNQKRRRIDDHRRQDEEAARAAGLRPDGPKGPGAMTLNGTDYVTVSAPASSTARGGALHPSLPSRPAFDIVPKDEGKERAEQEEKERAKKAMAGSNSDIVKNRRAIRMANMSAAQALKAELEGTLDGDADADAEPAEAVTSNGDAKEGKPAEVVTLERTEDEEKVQMGKEAARGELEKQAENEGVDEEVVPSAIRTDEEEGEAAVAADAADETMEEDAADGEGDDETTKKRKRGDDSNLNSSGSSSSSDDEDDDDEAPPNPEADQPIPKKKLKVNPDGTVEGYVDDVKLWEPGYRERYYERKFGVPLSDTETISKVTRSYMEGLCWVLEYYYQGVPAWDWYYPYHYAPFAQDFTDVGKLNIEFEVSMPFKPFAQLLGVFPAASRIHLPEPLQTLMINEDSPILDFYPGDFEIDMNGKKMAWQGVALLPFIDQHRLLTALASKEGELSDDEKRRNSWGDNIMFISAGHPLFDVYCATLYGLKAKDVTKPIPIDTNLSHGMSGSVLADSNCVPASTFDTPIPSIPECPDLSPNDSLSVRYYFPRQAHPHRSILLRGYKPEQPRLSESDKDWMSGPGMARGSYSSGPAQHRGAPIGGGGGGGGYAQNNQRAPPGGDYNPMYMAPASGRPQAQGAYGNGGYGGAPQGGYGYAGAYASMPAGNPYAGQQSYGAYQPRDNRNPYGAPPPNPYAAPAPGYGAPRNGPGAGYGAPAPRGGGGGGAYNPYGSGAYQPRNGGGGGGGGGRRY